ncbi:restriction endonuclease subunit S [Campylobacter sp. LR286c]|uniref:restriction endonuclease subunit S n=2 Tax=Campylobacter TaxID=194 RepID=UPI001CC1C8C1|nr:restriction endonuclease subunit S [Campylobacter sp. LR286c]
MFFLSHSLLGLEEKFKQEGGEFREFRLKDLFFCERGTRLVKNDRIKGEIPLITAGEQNQGVKEFIGNENQKIFSNAITIDMFCNSFIHISPFCCDDNILVLTAKIPINRFSMQYISTTIGKDKEKWSYGKQYRQNSFIKHKITLPVKNNQIAFDYMESYVRELDAYLTVSGLKDYVLNEEEKQVLNVFNALNRGV